MRKGSWMYVWACGLMLLIWLPNFCEGRGDSLKPGQLLTARSANDTISSSFFTLGFFNLTTSDQNKKYTKWYAGVWYAEIHEFTVVWIANRERPLSNPSSAVLNLTDHGYLVLSDNGSAIWSSSGPSKPASYVSIRPDGNLMVFGAENSSEILWQSFDEPGDKWLPGMMLTENRKLTAWASKQDPFPGLFQLQIRDRNLVLTNKTSDHGNILGSDTLRQLKISYLSESESFVYYQGFEDYYSDRYSFLQLSSDGQLQVFRLEPEQKYRDKDAVIYEWEWLWQLEKKWPVICGANAVDVVSGSKWPWASSKCQSFVYRSDVGPCACPLGFVADAEDFSPIYACNRKIATACINDGSYSASSDLFIAICTQFPSHGVLQSGVPGTATAECEKWCRLNCSCTAYAVADNGSCVHWFGNLSSLRIAGNSSSSIFVRLNYQIQLPNSGGDVETDDNSTLSPATAPQPSVPGSTPATKHTRTQVIAVAVAVAVVAVAATCAVLCICIARRRTNTPNPNHGSKATTEGLRVFTYRELREATNNFSDRLGKGAFGSVFKGNLRDGTPVAVKRLEGDGFSHWDQKQFQAEVSTIGVVSHINVMRLLGFCSSDDAKRRLLVYEFMPNDSLAALLFHQTEAPVLDWSSRFQIALGTARGLAYLHESCRYYIIHCDIKPDNILLDADFRPKISDFGLAKLLNRNHSQALTTLRGTFGYMAPEWISGDPVTSKADVYSFGMVLLEILSGRRHMRVAESVQEHVRLVAEISRGNGLAALDWRLQGCVQKKQAQRMAVAAVWCIQDDPGARPCMSQVLKLLEGIIAAPRPPPPVPASLLSLVEDVPEVHTFALSSKETLP